MSWIRWRKVPPERDHKYGVFFDTSSTKAHVSKNILIAVQLLFMSWLMHVSQMTDHSVTMVV